MKQRQISSGIVAAYCTVLQRQLQGTESSLGRGTIVVHQYKNNGYNIVLDVNSGAVHVVDDLVYDMIPLFEEKTVEELTAHFKGRYEEQDIRDAASDLQELKDAGVLYTEDNYKDIIIDFKKRSTVVKALCLHIAHDCNLAVLLRRRG